MDDFYRIKRLPPYVFAIVNDLKSKARARGEDVIDLGMGNPDMATPKHIVDKLVEAAKNPKNHRYSASRGITRLRVAMAKWYRDRYAVDLNPDSEVIATIGAKEGMAHLALAVLQPGDGALVPNPTYPIHSYSVVIADGDLRSVPLTPDGDFFARLQETARLAWPKAKLLILSFPHNPTTMCVDRDFFVKVVDFAREHRLMVVHDFAYADFTFDGYQPPSFLEVPGARDVGVEIFSTSNPTWTTAPSSRSRSPASWRSKPIRSASPRSSPSTRSAATCSWMGSTSSAGAWRSRRARCSCGRRSPKPSAAWAPSSSPSCSSRRPGWRCRRASASASTVKATFALRSWRTSSESARRCAGSSN